MNSIRRRLIIGLLVGLTLTCLVTAYGIYRMVCKEAAELFDYELRTVALSLPHHIAIADSAEQPTQDFAGISDDGIEIQTWNNDGSPDYQPEPNFLLPEMATGFHSFRYDGREWRSFGLQDVDRYIQVAQPFSVREDLAITLASRMLWPLLLWLPLTIAVVLIVVRRGLAPLRRVSAEIGTRSPEALMPISQDHREPVEIQPLVAALNALLQKVQEASLAQRIFVADAAHELRTPLAALKLQIQVARAECVDDAESMPRVAAVSCGTPASITMKMLEALETRLNRIIHVAQQLLAMAREDAAPAVPGTAVSLRAVAETVISDLSVLAEVHQIDLGLDCTSRRVSLPDLIRAAEGRLDVIPAQGRDAVNTDSYTIIGEPPGLATLLSNLVDNAIRHTPPGGKVDVRLIADGASVDLQVLDTGTGVADEELPRIFDRFYRAKRAIGQGSGLGLAIVLGIANRHGVGLTALNRMDQSGFSGLDVLVSGFKRAHGSAGFDHERPV